MFDSLKKAVSEAQESPYPFIREDEHGDSLSHFAADTKIVTSERSNGIILVGRSANIERLSEFIRESVDVAPKEGKSILHTYDLQYLDAKTFAPQLQKIVSSLIQADTQATQAMPRTGKERFF